MTLAQKLFEIQASDTLELFPLATFRPGNHTILVDIPIPDIILVRLRNLRTPRLRSKRPRGNGMRMNIAGHRGPQREGSICSRIELDTLKLNARPGGEKLQLPRG